LVAIVGTSVGWQGGRAAVRVDLSRVMQIERVIRGGGWQAVFPIADGVLPDRSQSTNQRGRPGRLCLAEVRRYPQRSVQADAEAGEFGRRGGVDLDAFVGRRLGSAHDAPVGYRRRP
jgi:hypothetical protein